MQFGGQLPEEWRTSDFQKKVTQEVNNRLADPAHEFPEDVKAQLDAMKPLTDRLRDTAEQIQERLGERPETAEFRLSTPEEGYAHRVRDTEDLLKGTAGAEGDAITGQRTLSKFAPSTKSRQFYVYEDESRQPHMGPCADGKGGAKWRAFEVRPEGCRRHRQLHGSASDRQ